MNKLIFVLLALAVCSCGYNTYHISVKNDSGIESYVKFDGNPGHYRAVLPGKEISVSNLSQTDLREFACSNRTFYREYDFYPYDNWFAASVNILISIGTNSISFNHGNWKAKK